MNRRPPHRRSRIGFGLAAAASLAACTATPRYPIDRGAKPGQGFEAVSPRYPIDPSSPPPPPPAAASPPPPFAEVPATSRLSAPVPASAAVSRRDDVDEAPLAPVVSRRERAARALGQAEPPPRTEPTIDLPKPRVRRIPGALTYALVRGDTLYGVARRFGVGPLALASDNGLTKRTALRPGLRLKLPVESRDGGEQTHATGLASRAAARSVIIPAPVPRRAGVSAHSAHAAAESGPTDGPVPYNQLVGHDRGRARRDPVRTSAAAAAAADDRSEVAPAAVDLGAQDDSAIMHAALGRFIRPVHGETLSTFGVKGPGQRNDGVDLAAREGEVVRASASGVVVYAGHDVPALGNLVAVKHSNGWVTVYGNLEKITVRATERLAQGAPLGVAGATNVTPTPRVHFEVRYAADPAEKAHPVDPDLVLPKAG